MQSVLEDKKMSVLSVKGIYKEYPGFKLQDVSFEIEKGDYVSIIGENGTGKSSLLKGILDLVSLREGQIIFDEGCSRKNIGYEFLKTPKSHRRVEGMVIWGASITSIVLNKVILALENLSRT